MKRDADCRDIETDLTAYHQGELSPERRAAIARHLAECPTCARALEEIGSVFDLAGTIEDLSPSMRFRRNMESLLRRAGRAVPSGHEGLLSRAGSAGAFLLYRLRTSSRFRLATVSVGIHVVLLLILSLVIVPRMVPKHDARVVVEMESAGPGGEREAGSPAETDDRPSLPPEPGYPDLREASPYPDETAPPGMAGSGALPLPPSHRLVRRPLTPLFAVAVDCRVKERRLASLVEDPRPVLRSVGGALRWLASRQEKDGGFPVVKGAEQYRTGVTATAILAFLSDGHGTTRGEAAWRPVVARGIERLLADQLTDGPLAGLIGPARGRYMYGHALGTLALVESYCLDYYRLSPKRRVTLRAAIRRALSLIVAAQSPEGAWGYQARAGGHDRIEDDTSVSLYQMMALASARSARLLVREDVFARFTPWLRRVTGEDGVVGYHRAGDRPDDGPRILTAGALFLEETLGLAAPLRDRQAAEVAKRLTDRPKVGTGNGLLRFYASLAFSARGRAVFDRFLPALLADQRPDGSWASGADLYARLVGDTFLTALNVLTITGIYRFPGA